MLRPGDRRDPRVDRIVVLSTTYVVVKGERAVLRPR